MRGERILRRLVRLGVCQARRAYARAAAHAEAMETLNRARFEAAAASSGAVIAACSAYAQAVPTSRMARPSEETVLAARRAYTEAVANARTTYAKAMAAADRVYAKAMAAVAP
jgi:hypothetical protein